MKYEVKLHMNYVEDLKFIRTFVLKIENRPILTGFSVLIKSGNVYLLATDSFKAVEAKIGEIEDKEVLYIGKSFPVAIIDLLAKAMKKSPGIFSIDTDCDRVSFQYSSKTPEYSVTAMQGIFPDIDYLFNGFEGKVEIKKSWYQEFRYMYTDDKLRPYLQIGQTMNMYFDSDNFDFIVKKFSGYKGEIQHHNNHIKPLLLTFQNSWSWRILVLPVRVE